MKAVKTDNNLLTIQMMSDKTGLSNKSLWCAVKRLGIYGKRTRGIGGYVFTNEQFKTICSDDYIFDKLHNPMLRDYDRPPVVITYHIYESKMNTMV
jgi:hypothetical protein